MAWTKEAEACVMNISEHVNKYTIVVIGTILSKSPPYFPSLSSPAPLNFSGVSSSPLSLSLSVSLSLCLSQSKRWMCRHPPSSSQCLKKARFWGYNYGNPKIELAVEAAAALLQ